MAWYPGMEGGTAVAELLVGAAEPEGRLPLTWPTATTELPPFRRFTRRIAYGPLHGYRLMEATGQQPAHWFGHGLAYTSFAWSDPAIVDLEPLEHGRARVTAEVTIRNVGDRPGTVLFCSDEHATFASHERPCVGDRVRITPAHIDPTMALHEVAWVVRGDDVIDRWPIDLRGW